MLVSLFDFNLPKKCIAQKPANPRDSSKLLHVSSKTELYLRDYAFHNLPDLLLPGDLVVFNNTKVIPARLTGYSAHTKLTGSSKKVRIEATLHQKIAPNCWRAFIKPAKKVKLGDKIEFAPEFSSVVQSKITGGEVELLFSYSGAELKEKIANFGSLPLPPYIKRKNPNSVSDRINYQTMFALYDGAIAAPTASLHFTPRQIKDLKCRGVNMVELTLHVGAGTFLPVKVGDTKNHPMHPEWGQLLLSTAKLINNTKKAGGRIIACGTTVLRLLETAASESGAVKPFEGETKLFITPGYRFKVVDLLLTNFHQPKSTLFMLVAAFAGLNRIKNAYNYAISNNYRFYSYGDCSLIEKTVIGDNNG